MPSKTDFQGNEWPGAVKEAKELSKELLIPDVTKLREYEDSDKQWKAKIRKAVSEKNEKDLKDDMEKYSKLDEMKKERFEIKKYLTDMSMYDARTLFRIRTRMIKCKMNQPSDKKNKETLWKCSGCDNIDTQTHILWCPAYQDLREGKSLSNDADIVEYFKKVMLIREKLDL